MHKNILQNICLRAGKVSIKKFFLITGIIMNAFSGFIVQGLKTIKLFTVNCSLFTLVMLSTVTACTNHTEKIYRKSRIVMDTIVTISAVSDSGDKAETAIERAFAEIEELDSLVNFFSGKSEVSLINKNAGIRPVKVSPLTMDIIEKAKLISEKTGGAFDITIGTVMTLWDFHKKVLPDEKMIKGRLHLVDYKKIVLDKKESTVYLRDKGMLIDLGAIAKGYAADIAVEALRNNGISAGIVAVAGDIKAFGLKPDNRLWKAGIRDPKAQSRDKEDAIIAAINLDNMAISTSGDYERFFTVKSRRFHHILDPATGYPATGCISVSIVTKEGVFADSLATGVFVLGVEKGLRLLKEMSAGGVIIDTAGRTHMTENLRDKIEFKGNL